MKEFSRTVCKIAIPVTIQSMLQSCDRSSGNSSRNFNRTVSWSERRGGSMAGILGQYPGRCSCCGDIYNRWFVFYRTDTENLYKRCRNCSRRTGVSETTLFYIYSYGIQQYCSSMAQVQGICRCSAGSKSPCCFL